MKKIGLFLSAGSHNGGMFQYSLAVLAALAALSPKEYSVVAAFADPAWEDRLQRTPIAGLPVTLGPSAPMVPILSAAIPSLRDSWQRWFSALHPLATRLAQQKCELWIFPCQDVWGACFALPVLAAIHDLMHRYESSFPEASGHRRYRYREAYLRELARRSKGILVDSCVGKQHVEESYHVPGEKIFVLPYVAPEYVHADEGSPGLSARYQLPVKYLFYPAQFWEHKNHVRLIQAVAELRDTIPDICLVLAGHPKNGYSASWNEVKNRGLQQNVRFLGYVPESDIPKLYRRARALIFPELFWSNQHSAVGGLRSRLSGRRLKHLCHAGTTWRCCAAIRSRLDRRDEILHYSVVER